MKLLSSYSDDAAFEVDKPNLEQNSSYAALAVKEKNVHVKEVPNMVDIAIYDNVNEEILLIRGWEYNDKTYPTDRYTPIGVEVIPRNHMDDGYARIMSLNYMRYDTPKVGGGGMNMMFGLFNLPIEGIEYKTFVPCLNEEGNTDLGEVQEIKRWVGSDLGFKYFSTEDDKIENRYIKNPFTKNEAYYVYKGSTNENLIPSPYTQNMMKNPIFYTENPTSSQPSLIIDMDGKEKSEKIINQLAVNLGNEDWKTGDTIPSTTSETLDYSMICPPVQCCWMYSTVGTNQGDWYLPSIGELSYLVARKIAIQNSINQIQLFIKNIAIDFSYNEIVSSSSYNNITILSVLQQNGNMNPRNRNSVTNYAVRAYMKI